MGKPIYGFWRNFGPLLRNLILRDVEEPGSRPWELNYVDHCCGVHCHLHLDAKKCVIPDFPMSTDSFCRNKLTSNPGWWLVNGKDKPIYYRK